MPKNRKPKTKVTISVVEALVLMNRFHLAAEKGEMLDVMMPNGKLLRDCTRTDLVEILEALEGAGPELDRLKNFLSI